MSSGLLNNVYKQKKQTQSKIKHRNKKQRLHNITIKEYLQGTV